LELEDDDDRFNEPAKQPTSYDDSPALKQKRKHQDIESPSDCEADDRNAKAHKINHRAGRPRAADYDDLAKELILQAAIVYRCLLSTEDAFPDLAHEAEMVMTAWEHVNRETGMTPLHLSPDIVKIVSNIYF
jgi:hypothetical protein